jgi:hypothetical protein
MRIIHLSPTVVIAIAVLGVMALAFVTGYATGYLRRSLVSWRRRRQESERGRAHRRVAVQHRHR